MVTAIKGDPESRRTFVRGVLDKAFSDRISTLFNVLCTDFVMEQPVEQAEMQFVQKFKSATDAWNAATAAIDAEYAPPAP